MAEIWTQLAYLIELRINEKTNSRYIIQPM